jgi:general secretion pathway protein G
VVLKENLNQMRDAIGKYYADKGKYPESIETLASEKYLRRTPLDPVTESATTWVVVPPDDPQKGGVYDVRSGAPGVASDGTAYAEW